MDGNNENKDKVSSLAKRFKDYKGDNKPEFIDWGADVGKEKLPPYEEEYTLDDAIEEFLTPDEQQATQKRVEKLSRKIQRRNKWREKLRRLFWRDNIDN